MKKQVKKTREILHDINPLKQKKNDIWSYQ